MRLLALALCAAGLAAACKREPLPAAPQLFESRAPYAPLEKRLRESGGDPSRALLPASAADLLKLAPGQRYKYAVRSDGTLALAPLPADEVMATNWVHPLLAGGAAVRTAGFLRVDHDATKLVHLTVDQDSRAYCPTAASLIEAVKALRAIGVGGDLIAVEDKQPQCGGAMQ